MDTVFFVIMMPAPVYHAPSTLVTTPALLMQMDILLCCYLVVLISFSILRNPTPDLSLRLICMKALLLFACFFLISFVLFFAIHPFLPSHDIEYPTNGLLSHARCALSSLLSSYLLSSWCICVECNGTPYDGGCISAHLR